MTDFTLARDVTGATIEATTVSDTTASIHLIAGQTAYIDIPSEYGQYKLDIQYISNIPDDPSRNSVTVQAMDYPLPPDTVNTTNPPSVVVSGGSRIFFSPARADVDTDVLIFITMYKLSDSNVTVVNDPVDVPTWIECVPSSFTVPSYNQTYGNFSAYGHFPSGVYSQVTTQCTWTSDDPTIASVALQYGGATITTYKAGHTVVHATFIGTSVTAQLQVTVTDPVLRSIAITPNATTNMYKGQALQFTATGTYSDTSTQEITNIVTWYSDNTIYGTINNSGLMQSAGVGSTVISCSYESIASNSTQVNVTAAVVSSAYITPSSTSVRLGQITNLVPHGIYTDGSEQTVTPTSWHSSNPAVISVVGSTITALTYGYANITFDTYSPLYDGNFVTSSPCSINVLDIPADPSQYKNYITNGQFTVTNNNIIYGTTYDVSKSFLTGGIFWILGNYNYQPTLSDMSGFMFYYRTGTSATATKDQVLISRYLYNLPANPYNAPHRYAIYMDNLGQNLTIGRRLEAVIGDITTFDNRTITITFNANAAVAGDVTVNVYYNRCPVSFTGIPILIGTVNPAASYAYYSMTVTLPGYPNWEPNTFPVDTGNDNNYFSIIFEAVNNTTGATNLLLTDLECNLGTTSIPIEFKSKDVMKSYQKTVSQPDLQFVSTLASKNNNVLETDGNVLTVNRDINNYGMSCLSYSPAIPPMTLALWPKPPTGYYPVVAPPVGWLKCVSETLQGARPDYSSTKYRRLVKAFIDAGISALFMPYDIIAAYNPGSAGTIVITSNTSGTQNPFATLYNLPTFSTTHTNILINVVCGTGADIGVTNNQGYFTITTTLNNTWYVIFVINGVIVYPSAVTEREKIIYVNIQSNYTANQVALGIYDAMRPYGTGYATFSTGIAPSAWTALNISMIIKT